MGKMERILNIFTGLGMIAFAVVIICYPDYGFLLIGSILSLILTFSGIRYLNYYRSMARHMVGGRQILYMGIMLLDMGIFLGGLVSIHPVYVILYLLGGYAFSGLVHILRAFEIRNYSSLMWIRILANGLFDIAIAALCLFFYQSHKTLVFIYCFGLVHSAILRLMSAFRRRAIIYIP